MEGWIGDRSLLFRELCREILGSTAANGATSCGLQLMCTRGGASCQLAPRYHSTGYSLSPGSRSPGIG
jgi:hypothetical protein